MPLPTTSSIRRGPSFDDGPAERLPLKDAVQTSLTEARMVLPGLQALFGFQLIAVFNERFDTALTELDRWLHLGALVAVAIAIALVMTPAAYHREVHRCDVTDGLLDLTSRLICIALGPLALGLALDLFVVARLVSGDVVVGLAVAVGAIVLLSGLWFGFPLWARKRRGGAG